MSVEAVKEYLKRWEMDGGVMEFAVSSATVEEAALAVGCEGRRIAKTLSFLVDGGAVLIVMAGDAKVDNRRFKERFHTKAVMLKPEEVTSMTGHAIGGVCPFALRDGVKVYLDESLRRFGSVYPACGSSNSAIQMSIPQLEECSGSLGWVDVGKGWQEDGNS